MGRAVLWLGWQYCNRARLSDCRRTHSQSKRWQTRAPRRASANAHAAARNGECAWWSETLSGGKRDGRAREEMGLGKTFYLSRPQPERSQRALCDGRAARAQASSSAPHTWTSLLASGRPEVGDEGGRAAQRSSRGGRGTRYSLVPRSSGPASWYSAQQPWPLVLPNKCKML